MGREPWKMSKKTSREGHPPKHDYRLDFDQKRNPRDAIPSPKMRAVVAPFVGGGRHRRILGGLVRASFPRSFFDPFWNGFWLHFGSQNPSKMLPEAACKKRRSQKTQKRKIALPLNEKPCFLGPSSSQNGPKLKPNPCQEASENDVGKMT